MSEIESTELGEMITQAVAAHTSEPALRELVEKNIAAIVARAVKDQLEPYGDTGKQIVQAVKDALKMPEPLDVPDFGNTMLVVLRGCLMEVMEDHIKERVEAEMAGILSIAGKEIKLSRIVETMVEELDQADRYGSYVTCLVQDDTMSSTRLTGNWLKIGLDEQSDVRTVRECAVQIHTNEGKIYHLVMDGRDAKTSFRLGSYPEWKKTVFAAYCSGSKLIADEDECVTSVGDF